MALISVVASRSEAAFLRAQKRIPGGVNSPVRSCSAVNSSPIFIKRADGAYVFDLDGNRYIDYVGSWGPMILGHRHPRVLEALEDALICGISYGAPSESETELTELICQFMPSIEMLRMVNSGTEATMSAIRLARAFTKRTMLIKFDGCYHGHADSFLGSSGSGLATLGITSSPGVPDELAKLTLSLPFNDLKSATAAFEQHPKDIAAIIVEPIVGNAGLILPADGFLDGLRQLCTKYGALLIFDEVMTGFRVAHGGAQSLYNIKPDLTTLGKIIGAGLPVGAYGGRKDIMEMVAPLGPVYQAGTLSGNPLAMAAGLAQLKMLESPGFYETLSATTKTLADGFKSAAADSGLDLKINSVTGMITVFFTSKDVTDFASAKKSDTKLFAKFWQSMLAKGIYLPPSQFEAAFISCMHSTADIHETIQAFKESLALIKA